MQLAQSFASAIKPTHFSDHFLENVNVPQIDFMLVEASDHVKANKFDFQSLDDESGFTSKAIDWVAENTQAFYHLPKDRLGVWKGIEQTAAPATQEWKTCISRYGTENVNKDPETCQKKYINYTTSCEDVEYPELNDYVTVCSYCVQYFNMTEPVCTSPCENATSYVNDFGETVYDMRCIDPIYQ